MTKVSASWSGSETSEAVLKRDTAVSSKYVAVQFLKMFNDRRYIRSSLSNGSFRYAPAKPNCNESKLVAILASAFHEMRRISKPAIGIQRSLQQMKVTRS